MQTTNAACLGLYEKALPADLSWPQRLATAAELGFEFVEMSIDEQPARQQRLDWIAASGWRLSRRGSTAG